MSDYSLNLLGSPFIDRRDASQPQKLSPSAAGLLAYLSLHPNPTSREHLASLLWPKVESPKARHSLRQLLSRVRKDFPGIVVADKERVAVDSSQMEVDVHRFEEEVRERRIRSALTLWRGPFLEGWSWSDSWELEDWVERERSRLERLLESSVMEVGEVLLGTNRPEEAVEVLESAAPRLTLSDDFSLLRARALAASGFRPEAEAVLAGTEMDDDDSRVLAALEEFRNGNGKPSPVPPEERGPSRMEESDPDSTPVLQDPSELSPKASRKNAWALVSAGAVVILASLGLWRTWGTGLPVASPVPPIEIWFCSHREEEHSFRMNEDGDEKYSLSRVDGCPVIPVNGGERALALHWLDDGQALGDLDKLEFRPLAGPFTGWGNSVPARQAGPMDGTVSPDGRTMVAALILNSAVVDTVGIPRYPDGIGPFELGAILDLFLIDLETGGLTQITDDAARDYEPRFLPDGTGIVWGSQRDGPGDLYLFDLESGETTRITHGTLPARDPSVQGNLVAFHRGWGDREDEGDQDIFLLDLATREETRLTSNDWNDTGAELSHDGEMICWTSKNGGHWESEIMAMDLISGDSWPVFDGPGREDYCQWHPSAPVVLFQVWGAEESEIYRSVMGARGPGVNLSRHVTSDQNAAVMGVGR